MGPGVECAWAGPFTPQLMEDSHRRDRATSCTYVVSALKTLGSRYIHMYVPKSTFKSQYRPDLEYDHWKII